MWKSFERAWGWGAMWGESRYCGRHLGDIGFCEVSGKHPGRIRASGILEASGEHPGIWVPRQRDWVTERFEASLINTVRTPTSQVLLGEIQETKICKEVWYGLVVLGGSRFATSKIKGFTGYCLCPHTLKTLWHEDVVFSVAVFACLSETSQVADWAGWLAGWLAGLAGWTGWLAELAGLAGLAGWLAGSVFWCFFPRIFMIFP